MAKKNFNEVSNPALQFMTPPEEQNHALDQAEASDDIMEKAAGFKGLKRGRKPSTEETKTKRLNLLMLPSVCESIGKIATMKRCSTNELINSILQEYIEDNQELLQKYDDVFGV
jgi:hypothetical protein